MRIPISLGVEGYYQIEAFKTDAAGVEVPGSRRVAAPWFPNLITEGGLERIGANSLIYNQCQVGAGSAVPVPTDSALASRVAATISVPETSNGVQPTAPYFGWCRLKYRFAEGVAAGNLSEVGVGWAASGSLFSRALILDPGGLPTTITVAPDESLDVTYELRVYPPTTDATGSITLDGVSYTWVARAAQVTTQNYWLPGTSGVQVSMTAASVYSGDIGAITAGPSGTNAGISASRGAYSANSRKIATNLSAAIGAGNIAGGFKSIWVRSSGANNVGSYQIGFTPAVPKDNTKVFALSFDISWARYTP